MEPGSLTLKYKHKEYTNHPSPPPKEAKTSLLPFILKIIPKDKDANVAARVFKSIYKTPPSELIQILRIIPVPAAIDTATKKASAAFVIPDK